MNNTGLASTRTTDDSIAGGLVTEVGAAPLPSGHARKVVMLPLWEMRPSPENDRIYGPVDRSDPIFWGLVEDVRRNGIRWGGLE